MGKGERSFQAVAARIPRQRGAPIQRDGDAGPSSRLSCTLQQPRPTHTSVTCYSPPDHRRDAVILVDGEAEAATPSLDQVLHQNLVVHNGGGRRPSETASVPGRPCMCAWDGSAEQYKGHFAGTRPAPLPIHYTGIQTHAHLVTLLKYAHLSQLACANKTEEGGRGAVCSSR